MKIMYLLYSFTIGGTEKLVSDICNEISKSHDVYLYIVNDYYDDSMISKLSSSIHVILYGRKVGAKNKLKTMIDICGFCKEKNIDVIHCNALNTPELLIISKLFIPKIKIIYTIHGIGQYETLGKMRIFYRNKLCNSIIAISHSVYEDIISNGADKKKTIIVHNAINLESFYMREHATRASQFRIGNVARIDISKKGQDILLNALISIKDKYTIKCIFAGAPDERHEEEFQELIDKAAKELKNAESIVEFIGSISDVPQFLENIDLFVLPSRLEGFGISLIEAMSMGIPCISSDINGPKEIIGDEERGYLFESESAESLAEKIIYVINNYDEALIKAEKAKKYVEEKFDIKVMCKKLIKIYSICSEPR